MRATFDQRIARATQLAETHTAARELLRFYSGLALFQKAVFEELRSNGKTDVRDLLRYLPALVEFVRRSGPEPLIEFATWSMEAGEALLLADVEDGGAGPFFARALLQPHAESLAQRGQIDFQKGQPTCPFCDASPVVAVLRGEGDGAKRWLLCSMCSTEWPFRRVICPHCGEQDKDKLPIYTAAGIDHVRVEACDSCRTYIKSVDLTKDGLAVPVVDELATVALNIWADEHGYTKLRRNVLGL